MSNIVSRGSDPDPKVKFLSIALAFVLVLFWGFLIAGMWWFFDNRENTYAEGLVNWIARFHVLLVHIPVGLIFLVIALEVFGKVPGFDHIREATTFTLWGTLLGAISTSILGFLLMRVEEYAGKAMTFHMWTGLAVVVTSLFALIFKLKGQGGMYGLTLLICALCVSAAGHYGGAMVHGADYLSEYAPPPLQKPMLAGLSASSDSEHEEAPIKAGEKEIPFAERNVYEEFVHPILKKSCNECHDENKVKGKLRMDTHELLLAGADGSDYPTVVPGDSDESELIVRVTLDSDDDEFMPPKGDGLTAEEINLLELWIKAGAKKELTVAQLGEGPSVMASIAAVESILAGQEVVAAAVEPVSSGLSVWDSLSTEEQTERLTKVQTEAEKLNISIIPVSAEDDRLQVNVLNGASEFGDEQIQVLAPVAERITMLNLARSQITNDGLKVVGKMHGLEKLYLENTKISDAGIAHLTTLKKLTYLNLYGTEVSNGVFDSLKQMPSIRKLFVWQTKVTEAEARIYERSVNLAIDTGVDLEKAAAEAKAKKEAEEAALEAEKKAEALAKKKAAEEAARKKAAKQAAAAKKKAEEAAAAADTPAPVEPQ